jgi:hypothetical protein
MTAVTGEDALLYNPSGLPRFGKTTLLFTNTDLYGLGIEHTFLGLNTNVKGVGLGAAFSRFHDPELAYLQQTLQASGAMSLSPAVTFGATLRYGTLKSEAGGANSLIADLGLIWQPVSSLQLGLLAQNALAAVNYERGEETPPERALKAGAAINLPGNAIFAVNIPDLKFNLKNWQYGFEKWYSDQFGVRLGLNDGRITAGLSFVSGAWKIDYAYLPHELGQTHRVALKASLGGD